MLSGRWIQCPLLCSLSRLNAHEHEKWIHCLRVSSRKSWNRFHHISRDLILMNFPPAETFKGEVLANNRVWNSPKARQLACDNNINFLDLKWFLSLRIQSQNARWVSLYHSFYVSPLIIHLFTVILNELHCLRFFSLSSRVGFMLRLPNGPLRQLWELN